MVYVRFSVLARYLHKPRRVPHGAVTLGSDVERSTDAIHKLQVHRATNGNCGTSAPSHSHARITMTLRQALNLARLTELEQSSRLEDFANRCKDTELRNAVLQAAKRHRETARTLWSAVIETLPSETLDAKVGDA